MKGGEEEKSGTIYLAFNPCFHPPNHKANTKSILTCCGVGVVYSGRGGRWLEGEKGTGGMKGQLKDGT